MLNLLDVRGVPLFSASQCSLAFGGVMKASRGRDAARVCGSTRPTRQGFYFFPQQGFAQGHDTFLRGFWISWPDNSFNYSTLCWQM